MPGSQFYVSLEYVVCLYNDITNRVHKKTECVLSRVLTRYVAYMPAF